MKAIIAAVLIAAVPLAATAATQPVDLGTPAVVSLAVVDASVDAQDYVQEVKFGHFKKRGFKKGFGGGFKKKKFVGKKFKRGVFFY